MKTKRGKDNKEQWFLVFSSFLVGSLVTIFIVLLINHNTGGTNSTINTKALNKAIDATVSIASDSYETENGTGFIYKIKGKYAYILTNEHVVEGNYVYVTNSKKEEIQGKVLGHDKYQDLAVVRIEKKYAPNKLDKFSTKTTIGETVYAVGSPIDAKFQGSVTSGIISGLDRQVKTTIDEDTSWMMRVLQFDAAINPGSSGGVLINQKGEILGICTMKYIEEDIEGMSFATASKDILKNIKTLEENKKIKKPDLGIAVVTTTADEADLPKNVTAGVEVTRVQADGYGEKNDILKGDIIIELDGNSTTDPLSFKFELYQHNVGDKITIKYVRDGKVKTKTLQLQ